MTDAEQKTAAAKFAKEWANRGYEKGESQPFWLALLRNVYGVEQPEHYISFEDKVRLDNTSFIDGIISETHVLIEQKGLGKNLTCTYKTIGRDFPHAISTGETIFKRTAVFRTPALDCHL